MRKQFNVPGKHPMEKLCPGCYEDGSCSMTPTEANDKAGEECSATYHGFAPSNSQLKYYEEHGEKTSAKIDDKNIDAIVKEVTKRILDRYGK